MSKHSPTPWKTKLVMDGEVQIIDSKGNPVVGFESDYAGLNYPVICTVVDLKRIATCVNACEGIETEDLIKNGIGAVHRFAAKLVGEKFTKMLPALIKDLNRMDAGSSPG